MAFGPLVAIADERAAMLLLLRAVLLWALLLRVLMQASEGRRLAPFLIGGNPRSADLGGVVRSAASPGDRVWLTALVPVDADDDRRASAAPASRMPHSRVSWGFE